jgi:uncharacterized protein YndB with AHSA1/START domain
MSDNQKLEIKTSLKIQKPVHDVFEAIVDPKKCQTILFQKALAV